MKAVLIAICLTFVLGASDVRAITVLGSGAVSCGSYLKAKDSMPIVHAANISWIMGFLSGVAAAKRSDVLNNTDSDAIEAAVTKYCQENPLGYVAEASTNVYFQLNKRTN
jgi:hypothetical protein